MFRRRHVFSFLARALLRALLLLLPTVAASPAAAAEDRPLQLNFSRTARTLGDLPCIDFAIKGVGILEDGKITGTVSVGSTLTHSETTEEVAQQEFTLEGTYATPENAPATLHVNFTVPGKLTYLCTKAPPKCEPGGFCVGQLWEYDWTGAKSIFDFDVVLIGGKFAEREQVKEGEATVEIATAMEIVGAQSKGEILVTRSRERIPGGPIPDIAGASHTFSNTITMTLPADAALEAAYRSGQRITVLARPKVYGGRLFETQAEAESARGGSLWLELTAVVPGRPETFYYAWPGDQPAVLEEERIAVEIIEPEGFAFTGEATFDVGFEPAVWNVRFEDETRKPRILEQLRLRVQVGDALTQGPVLPLLDDFDLAPVLRIEQTGFEPPPFLGYVVDWLGFDILAWGEYLQSLVAAQDPGDADEGPVRISGSERAWNVDPADGSLVGGGRLPRPTLFFRNVGIYTFDVSIAGVVSGAPSAPFDASGIMGALSPGLADHFEFEVEMLELPEIGGALGVLFNCIGLASDALDLHGLAPFKIPAFKKLKFIWSVTGCVKQVLGHAISLAPFRGIEMQWAGRAAKQVAEAPLTGLSPAELESIGRSPQLEEEYRVQATQAVVKGMDDLKLVLIRRSGLSGLVVESETDGRLSEGPAAIDPAVLAGIGGEAAASTAPKRLQTGERFVVVPSGENEALRIGVEESKAPAAIYLLTPETITRYDVQPRDWLGGIAIGGDGQLQRARGGALPAQPVPPLALGEAIDFPKEE